MINAICKKLLQLKLFPPTINFNKTSESRIRLRLLNSYESTIDELVGVEDLNWRGISHKTGTHPRILVLQNSGVRPCFVANLNVEVMTHAALRRSFINELADGHI